MQTVKECLTGGVAASGACFFTNPLEVVKTRMQLQGELQSRGSYRVHYRNVFHAFYTIGKVDGVVALQKGLVPGVAFQFVMNGLRLGTFQVFSDMGWTKNKDGYSSPLRCAVFGAASGCIGAVIGSPAYMFKTQLQAQANSEIAVGHQHNIKSLSSTMKSIRSQHGIVGLWRGASAAIARVSIGSAVQLTTFSRSKDYILQKEFFSKDSVMVPFTASMLAGLFLVGAMTPFDVVSTRMYNQGVTSKGDGVLYNNLFDVFRKIYRREGIMGFYKGTGAHYFRIGPHTTLSLVFWQRLRLFVEDES